MKQAPDVNTASAGSQSPMGIAALHGVPADVVARDLRHTKLNRKAPRGDDPRHVDGVLFPGIAPSFQIQAGDTVLTVGSCFAREIERNLTGFNLPVRQLAFRPDEVDGDPASIINEYNSGCIAQRLTWAAEGVDTARMTETVWGASDDSYDLILSKGSRAPVADLMDRRRRIDAVYSGINDSALLIVTLGLSEVWVDLEQGIFLNRIPDWIHVRTNPQRYKLLMLTPQQNFDLLAPVFQRLIGGGLQRIVVTVSPVPMGSTFAPEDAVVANCMSKSALRVAAGRLASTFPGQVDYFPSYEIVTSAGTRAYEDDLIHVRPDMVARIMAHFKQAYIAT